MLGMNSTPSSMLKLSRGTSMGAAVGEPEAVERLDYAFDSNPARYLGELSGRDWERLEYRWRKKWLRTAWVPWVIMEAP